VRRVDVAVSCDRDSVGRTLAHRRVRRQLPALSAAGSLADDPVHLLKRESSSRSATDAPWALCAAGAAPRSMNTIECWEGMSNFLPQVLHVTVSSTRIM